MVRDVHRARGSQGTGRDSETRSKGRRLRVLRMRAAPEVSEERSREREAVGPERQCGEEAMTKWEYKVTQFHWNEGAETSMNLLGASGWELVSCQLTDGWYKCVFKRQREGCP